MKVHMSIERVLPGLNSKGTDLSHTFGQRKEMELRFTSLHFTRYKASEIRTSALQGVPWWMLLLATAAMLLPAARPVPEDGLLRLLFVGNSFTFRNGGLAAVGLFLDSFYAYD